MTDSPDAYSVSVRSLMADRSYVALAWIAGMAGVSLPLFIVGFLFVNGSGVLSWEFLSEGPKGFPLGLAGGIWPAIQGSLALITIGLAVALPLGVGGALFLSEYSRWPLLTRTIRFTAECLAGIPSIVYGLFGYSFLVVFLSLKVSLLAGGITMGFVMFPLILVGSQEALEAVDDAYREAALGLGVSRAYVIRRIILKRALPGILSITVLAAGHAVGSAAPVLYTAAVIFSPGGLSLGAPVMTLPTHLYYLVGQALSFEHAYGTALVLVLGMLAVNFIALYLKRFSGMD